MRDRLSGWKEPAGTAHSITWNTDNDATRVDGVTRTIDARNRLLSNGSTTYAYAADGRTVSQSGPARSYSYDGFGELTGDGTSTFASDALGRTSTIGTAALSYAGLDHDAAKNGSVTVSRGPDGGAVLVGGKYAIADPHGDGVAEISNGGAVTSRTFTPFGAILNGSGSAAAGFQGDASSASGLVDMGARWFNPSTATFLSRDDIALSADEQNRYSYGLGNPVGMSDESGNCATPVTAPICVGAGIGSMAGPGGTLAGGIVGTVIGIGMGIATAPLINDWVSSWGTSSSSTGAGSLSFDFSGMATAGTRSNTSTSFRATPYRSSYADSGSYSTTKFDVQIGSISVPKIGPFNFDINFDIDIDAEGLRGMVAGLSEMAAGLDGMAASISSSMAQLRASMAQLDLKFSGLDFRGDWTSATPQSWVQTGVVPVGVAVAGPGPVCSQSAGSTACGAAMGTAGASCAATGAALAAACAPAMPGTWARDAVTTAVAGVAAATTPATKTKAKAECSKDQALTAHGCENLTDILQRNVAQARERLASDPALRNGQLSKREQSAEETRPWLGPINNGKALERYVASLPEVEVYFLHVGAPGMPDFVAYANRKTYEVTTDNQSTINKHLRRWYVSADRIATYRQWQYGG